MNKDPKDFPKAFHPLDNDLGHARDRQHPWSPLALFHVPYLLLSPITLQSAMAVSATPDIALFLKN
jgi:hypothetical protein